MKYINGAGKEIAAGPRLIETLPYAPMILKATKREDSRKAALYVAGRAKSHADAVMLLDMLGLTTALISFDE